MTSVTLIAVATPGTYRAFAEDMIASAFVHFRPCDQVQPLILPGIEGPWPKSTITRPKVMLDNWNQVKGDYVFCIDADMRFEQAVGAEVLGEITATQHPGYVNHHRSTLPYDRNPLSRACVPMSDGERYYCGGFFGGDRESVRDLLEQMAWICEPEAATPRWHDESALNRCLVDSPPTVILDPSYTRPDDALYYVNHVWGGQDFPRRIVALDKSPSQRGGRD